LLKKTKTDSLPTLSTLQKLFSLSQQCKSACFELSYFLQQKQYRTVLVWMKLYGQPEKHLLSLEVASNCKVILLKIVEHLLNSAQKDQKPQPKSRDSHRSTSLRKEAADISLQNRGLNNITSQFQNLKSKSKERAGGIPRAPSGPRMLSAKAKQKSNHSFAHASHETAEFLPVQCC